MEIRYPIVLVIFIALFFVIVFYKGKKKDDNNKKVANTHFIKNTDFYKSIVNKYKTIIYIVFGLLFLSVLGASLLTSRVITTSTHSNKIYDRDIMLCLDVSGSMSELDEEIIRAYGSIVDNMHGERFGIVIFDNSAYKLLPLTDDYDYVKDVIDKSIKAFNGMDTGDYKVADYIYEGTFEGEGSSIVGDGLASCVLSFPKLDEERSRIIILGTDNYVSGPQIITVPEAGKLAKKYKISIYPLDPEGYNGKEAKELQDIATLTGGKYYTIKDTKQTNDIVKSIEEKEKSVRETSPTSSSTDHPEVPLIIILLSLLGLIFMERVIKL